MITILLLLIAVLLLRIIVLLWVRVLGLSIVALLGSLRLGVITLLRLRCLWLLCIVVLLRILILSLSIVILLRSLRLGLLGSLRLRVIALLRLRCLRMLRLGLGFGIISLLSIYFCRRDLTLRRYLFHLFLHILRLLLYRLCCRRLSLKCRNRFSAAGAKPRLTGNRGAAP